MKSRFGFFKPLLSNLSLYRYTSAAGRAALLRAGPFRLAWSGISGLHFSVGGKAVAASKRAWNDAAWHTVNAGWNGTHASISVDGAAARTSNGAAAATAAAAVAAAAGDVTLGAADVSVKESLLRAQVDDVSLSVNGMHVALFRFNENSGDALKNALNATKTTASADGVLGSAAGAGKPKRVPSSAKADARPTLVTVEDVAVRVALAAVSPTASAAVTFHVASLPGKGALFAVNAAGVRVAPITSAPTALSVGATAVDFVPGANEHSASAGAVYATFSYTARAAGGAFDAAPVTVSVEVTPRNDAPTIGVTALTLLVAVNGAATLDLAAAASAADADGSALTYAVTSLPTRGALFHGDGVTPVSGPGEAVKVIAGKHQLVYAPPADVAGSALTTFGFVATDGELVTKEAIVTVSVSGRAALKLSGGGAYLAAPGSTLGLSPDGSAAFSLDAWAHAPAGDAKAASSALASTAVAQLSLTFGGGGATSSVTSNVMTHAALWPSELLAVPSTVGAMKGRWHHVAFVYGGVAPVGGEPSVTVGRRVYVDGELVAGRAASRVTLTAAQTAAVNAYASAQGEGSLAVGKGASRGVLVDDLRVWSRALTPMEVAAAAGSRSVAASGLLAHWTFDAAAAPLTATAGTSADKTLTPRGNGVGSTSASLETALPHTPTVLNPPGVVSAAAAGSALRTHSSSAGHALRFSGAGRASGSFPAAAAAAAEAKGMCVSLRFRTSVTAAVGGMPLASVAGGGDVPLVLKWTRAGGLTAVARSSLDASSSTASAAAASHRLLNDGAWHAAAACLAPDPAVEASLLLRLTVDGVAYHGDAALPSAAVFGAAAIALYVVVGGGSPGAGEVGGSTPGSGASSGFVGEVDELRVTSGDCLATAAYFNFDEAYGQEAKDATSSSSLLVSTGVEWVVSTVGLYKFISVYTKHHLVWFQPFKPEM